MITWLLLVSLFCKSIQNGNGQETGVLHWRPQNLTLTTSDQMILLTWEDDPSCSAGHDTLSYELRVFIADKQVHYEEVAVTPDQIGSTHSWNWTSHLKLECTSVELRSKYKNLTSDWIPGIKTLNVFPQNKTFKVGSRGTFCCFLPAGEIFDQMYVAGHEKSNTNITKINNQTYILTVLLKHASKSSCTNVLCGTKSRRGNGGACAIIGYPPDDRDLQCETRDLQSVECHWKVGRDTGFRNPTTYQLLGSQCENGSKGRCKNEVRVDAGERTWTVIAENNHGKVEMSDSADLTKRVHMNAPKRLTASTVNARNVTLEWKWTQWPQYNNLNITCQVNVSHGVTNTIRKISGAGLNFAVLNDLIPHWKYNVKVQCGTTQHFWKWSEWSQSIIFITKGDVPDALDAWMQVKPDQILITWKKPLANHSHGHIEDYEVTWAKTSKREQQNRTKVQNNHSVALSLNTTEEYIISVTARNINGSSPPSTITTPSVNPESSGRTRGRTDTFSVTGSNGGFNLFWSASPAASCGYIVDWCPTFGHCEVEWMKMPPNKTSASIFSNSFNEGVRYSLSVYACTQGAPKLLERREAYVKEKRMENNLFKSLKGKPQSSHVEVSWDPIKPEEQSAFIQGYVLYYSGNHSISTDNPEATNLTARNLGVGSYTFTVKARTAVGECGTTITAATLNSMTDNLVHPVLISMVTVFSLLSLITILCYRHWTCIKQTVYPSIPKPVLLDTSPGGNGWHSHCVDHHIEAYSTVSDLHCNSIAPENGYVSQENMPLGSTQTPKGYYDQALKRCTPPPPTSSPSQSGLPCAPFRGVFSNLSYLIMQTGDQQSNSGPELQEKTPLESCSSGYQPHSNTESFTANHTAGDSERPMFCDSTYILCPQLPSK